jgi:hypothetical protein
MQNTDTGDIGGQLLQAHLASNNLNWNFVKSTLANLPVASEESTRGSLKDDPMGRSLLVDLLSKDPSIDVIEACLRAFPDSLVMNVSAYFMASQCRDLNIIRSMIRYQKRQALDTCPYPWIGMSHVPIKAAEAIIEEYPQGVLEPCFGSKYCLLDRTLFAPDDLQRRQPAGSWFEKLILMLKSAELVTRNDKSTTFHPIHTLIRRIMTRSEFFKKRSVAQHCVWLLYQLRLKYPSLFRIVDGNGDAPIHVLLKSPCLVGPGSAYAQDFIAILVDAYGTSASLVTREGRLPLHLGLANGWPCHEILLRAAPHSLHRRDPVTFLCPFQLAACAKPIRRKSSKRARTETSGDLDVIYSLLRQDPLQACWGI